MEKQAEQLSSDECVVIITVASLPHAIIELPRPYTLELIRGIAGISRARVHRALRDLRLLGILTQSPGDALERANTLLPQVLAPCVI